MFLRNTCKANFKKDEGLAKQVTISSTDTTTAHACIMMPLALRTVKLTNNCNGIMEGISCQVVMGIHVQSKQSSKEIEQKIQRRPK